MFLIYFGRLSPRKVVPIIFHFLITVPQHVKLRARFLFSQDINIKKKMSDGNHITSKLLLVIELTRPATMMGDKNGFYLPN